MTAPLTPKLKEALDFIVKYIKEKGYPPAYREICDHPGNAMRMVDELACRGYVKRIGTHRRRNIVLLFDADAVPNWEGVANALMLENNVLRAKLYDAGIQPPPKTMEYP